MRVAFCCLSLALLGACPSASAPHAEPLLGSSSDEVAPPVAAEGEAAPSSRPSPVVAPDGLPTYESQNLPGGVACVIRLSQLGVAHRHLGAVRGVQTPVRVEGPLGGIPYRPLGRLPFVADCRLVLALHRAGPYLRRLGITEILYSNVYSYRYTPTGRLSLHGRGLAIDIHRVKTGDVVHEVQEDFTPGQEGGCSLTDPVLNRMACVLVERGLADQVLTPDFDTAHRDHFHVAIQPAAKRGQAPESLPADAD